MSKALSHFVHVFQNQGSAKTLFLLHGTGGSELDLIPLVENVQGLFNLVGLRGNISEGGMARFFIRKASGVFDQANIASESKKLAAFLTAWYEEHNTSADNAVFVGYSNGANMILATMLRHPAVINKAALMHPMMPFDPPAVDLAGKRFLVTHGLTDTMMPPGEADRVIAALQERGAQVSSFSHPGAHHLTYDEQTALLDFLRAK